MPKELDAVFRGCKELPGEHSLDAAGHTSSYATAAATNMREELFEPNCVQALQPEHLPGQHFIEREAVECTKDHASRDVR